MKGRPPCSKIRSRNCFVTLIPAIWKEKGSCSLRLSFFSRIDHELQRRSLRFPARCELEGIAAKLHQLAEPGRSALALLYLDALPAADIQRVLNIDERLLAVALDQARCALRERKAMIS